MPSVLWDMLAALLALCLIACPLMLTLSLAGLCLRFTREWAAKVLYRGAWGAMLLALVALAAAMLGFGAWSLAGCAIDLLRNERRRPGSPAGRPIGAGSTVGAGDRSHS
ncbi:MAG TPA: hypothetical protein VLA61_07785 [Ideonella sp.]|uniref:hypothetical protein n=1 Tax=Ideonella sp. TaxID=1929293 RepID=UPI002C8AB45B|nr:hypothetical protein [Ideonella sp.]HSI48152.1 hypothetical protein [Ideonella sp.]